MEKEILLLLLLLFHYTCSSQEVARFVRDLFVLMQSIFGNLGIEGKFEVCDRKEERKKEIDTTTTTHRAAI